MVEMKGNWLKLRSYREVNALLVHKKPLSFTKRMFLHVLSQNRSYQRWEDPGENDKGCRPSAIPNFRLKYLGGGIQLS